LEHARNLSLPINQIFRSADRVKGSCSDPEAVVKTRVVIVSAQSLFRSGLCKLLERKPHLDVVGEAASGREAVRLVRKLNPDILLLDVFLPKASELDVLKQLRLSPSTRVILLTPHLEANDVVAALRRGVRGVVLKNSAMQSVFNSIETVMAGQYWVCCEGASDLASAVNALSDSKQAKGFQPGQFGLTQRELDIVKGIASGQTNKIIGELLSISEHTVKNHVTNIFDKTGTSNRLELTLFAVERKLVVRPES
jgi:DNA-binding NarL/FixJ family response regulator